MDWLDEQLQSIRLTNKGLWSSLLLYLFGGLLLAVFAYGLTVSFCVGWERLLLDESQPMERFTDIFLRSYTLPVPQNVKMPFTLLRTVRQFNFIVYILLAVTWSSRRFYKDKICQPLLIMSETIKGIQQKDLSVSSYYKSGDEFEKICSGMEEMRRQLIEDQHQIVELHEEQRQVNAAFAHDIRTPLAVIQNNVELIRAFYPSGKMTEERMADSLEKIDRHLQRLKDFTFTMQEIQKIDEIDLVREYQKTAVLAQTVHEIGKALIDKEFSVQLVEPMPDWITIDLQIISQVVENLLANANRFAEREVRVILQVDSGFLFLFVHDDGKGFSKEEISKAATPYYSQDKSDHFGMGLTICQALTKKHGGVLRLSNAVNGGAVTSATFIIT